MYAHSGIKRKYKRHIIWKWCNLYKIILNNIYSLLDMVTDINYIECKYISALSSKIVILLDKIYYIKLNVNYNIVKVRGVKVIL